MGQEAPHGREEALGAPDLLLGLGGIHAGADAVVARVPQILSLAEEMKCCPKAAITAECLENDNPSSSSSASAR